MQCEYAKKQLSEIDVTEIFIQSYLNTEGKSSTLDVVLTRKEIEDSCKNRIDAGINLIDQILKDVGLNYKDIELCLPTGGMVNMPAIRRKLDQLFPGKVSEPKHGDRIISQGAAWIAHDKAIPVLAKPLEIVDASGAPFIVAQADHPLPTDGKSEIIAHSQFYSTDPRQGQVVFTFQRPVYLERYSQHTPRKIYDHLYLKIDPNAGPLVERLNLKIKIDENYIVKIEGISSGRRDQSKIEIVNLEFALRAYNKNDEENKEDENQYSENSNYNNDNNLELHRTNKVNEAYKLNPKTNFKFFLD